MTFQSPSDLLPDPDTVRKETSTVSCDTHGEYEETATYFPGLSDRPLRTGCPGCRKDRAEREAERERRQAESRRQAEIADLRRQCNVPARYVTRTLADYRATSRGQKFALSVCERYLEDFPAQAEQGRSLVMVGAPGTGKTHLACALAAGVIEQHQVPSRFVTVSDMLRSIKETYRRDCETTERQVIDSYARTGLLVVDELGVQIGSEHEKLLLFEVLNARYQELRPTILISNLSADDLEEFLGHRVMDRYRECGVVLAFDWESYRGGRKA